MHIKEPNCVVRKLTEEKDFGKSLSKLFKICEVKMKVSVSFIKSKYNERETIRFIDQTNADYLHVDVMDGKFVTEKLYFWTNQRICKETSKKLDVHLMCENLINTLKILPCLIPNI